MVAIGVDNVLWRTLTTWVMHQLHEYSLSKILFSTFMPNKHAKLTVTTIGILIDLVLRPHPQKGLVVYTSSALWGLFLNINMPIRFICMPCGLHVIPCYSQLLLCMRAIDAFMCIAMPNQSHDMLHPVRSKKPHTWCVPDLLPPLRAGSGNKTIGVHSFGNLMLSCEYRVINLHEKVDEQFWASAHCN